MGKIYELKIVKNLNTMNHVEKCKYHFEQLMEELLWYECPEGDNAYYRLLEAEYWYDQIPDAVEEE